MAGMFGRSKAKDDLQYSKSVLQQQGLQRAALQNPLRMGVGLAQQGIKRGALSALPGGFAFNSPAALSVLGPAYPTKTASPSQDMVNPDAFYRQQAQQDMQDRQQSGTMMNLYRQGLEYLFGDGTRANNPYLNGTQGLQALEPRQYGGPVEKDKPYLVGENGPEIFQPETSGRIIPNQNSDYALRGSPGGQLQMPDSPPTDEYTTPGGYVSASQPSELRQAATGMTRDYGQGPLTYDEMNPIAPGSPEQKYLVEGRKPNVEALPRLRVQPKSQPNNVSSQPESLGTGRQPAPVRPRSIGGLVPGTGIGVQQQGGATTYETPDGTATFQGLRQGGGMYSEIGRNRQVQGDRMTQLLAVNPALYDKIRAAGLSDRFNLSPEERRDADLRFALERQIQPIQSGMTLGEQAAISLNNKQVRGRLNALDARQQGIATQAAGQAQAQLQQANADRTYGLDLRRQQATEEKDRRQAEIDYQKALKEQKGDDKNINSIVDAELKAYNSAIEAGREPEEAQAIAQQQAERVAAAYGYIRAFDGKYISPQELAEEAQAMRKKNPNLTDEQIMALIQFGQ